MRSWIPGLRTRSSENPLTPVVVVADALDPARVAIEEELGTKAKPWLAQIGRRLLHNTPAMIGLFLVLFVVLVAILAPVIGRYDPNTINQNFSLSDLNQAPSGAHWFGTDYLGRDLYARIVWGARVSLLAGLGIVVVSFAIGVPLGIIAGYGGRFVDDLISRFLDLLLILPGILLALVLIGFLGPGLESVVIALGVAGVPGYARIARGSTLSAKQSLFVEAARSQGAGPAHIMFRHIFPNIVDPIVILGTLNLSGGILAAAAFSFLGVGTQVPASDWGTLLAQGYNHMFQSGAEIYFPGLAILITVLGINLLGDGLGDALNPRLRGR